MTSATQHAYIPQTTTIRPFLLAPPPPPRFKRKALAPIQPPTPPHNRVTPRSPLSPRGSFLDLTPTPVKSTTVFFSSSPVSPKSALDTPPSRQNNQNLFAFGYSVDIHTYHTRPPPPKPTNSKPTFTTKPRSKSISDHIMAIGSLTNLSFSRSKKNGDKPPTTKSNQNSGMSLSRTSSRNDPASYPRRGSVPTIPVAKEEKRRHPLPLPYNAVVELNGIFGDTRPIQQYHSTKGQVWRDEEEELEYAGLLKSGALRSASSTESENDNGKWKMFGSRAPKTFKVTTADIEPSRSSSSSSSDSHSEREESRRRHHVRSARPDDFAIPPSHHSSSNGRERSSRRRPAPLDLAGANPTYMPAPPPVPSRYAAQDDFFASSFAPPPAAPSPRRREVMAEPDTLSFSKPKSGFMGMRKTSKV